MQASTQAAPAPVAVIAQPSGITTVGADGKTITISIPKTENQVDALVQQRREISNQMSSVAERRQEIVNQIRSAPEGAARTGLEDHLKLLDQRTLQLESQLAVVGQQLAGAPAELVRSSEERTYTGGSGSDFDDGFMAGGGSVLAFFVVVYAWKRFRRKRRHAQAAPALAESDPRLERLERGMEAIAIEVERISEGQRFVTRILSESKQLAE